MAPRSTTSRTSFSIAACEPAGSAGTTGRIAVVHDAQPLGPVDPRLEVRPRRAAGGADRARPEPRPGTVGHEVVGRRADDRDVHSVELARVLRVRHAGVRQQPRVVRLVRKAERLPAFQRIEHAPILRPPLPWSRDRPERSTARPPRRRDRLRRRVALRRAAPRGRAVLAAVRRPPRRRGRVRAARAPREPRPAAAARPAGTRGRRPRLRRARGGGRRLPLRAAARPPHPRPPGAGSPGRWAPSR